MPLKESTLQRQLDVAQQERSKVESQFDGQELKKHPKWRQANAVVTSLEARLEKAKSRSTPTANAEDDSESGDDES